MGFNLRFKIIFITVAILVFAIGATTLAGGYVFSQEYSDVLQSRTLIIGQGIKSQLNRLLSLGIPLEELTGFEKQMQDTVSTYDDIAYAMIVDLDGKILFHNDSSQHNKILTDATTLRAVKSEKDVIQVYSDQAGEFYDVFIPIFDRSGTHVGAVRLGFPVELVTQKTTRLAVFSGTVAFVSLGIAVTLLVFTLSVWVTKPLTKLLAAIQEIRSGGTGLVTRVEIDSKDELGELSSAFNTMASQLHHLINTLDEQVTARTRQLETVMEISQRLTVILDLSDLLRQVVILTKETFNYYHVHIYLLDKSTKLLLLAEGYGQIGAAMKSRGHYIGLDAKPSLVALAARNRQIVKVDNVRESADWLPDPFLPDTQSEIAVPIILEEEVVGILDVQENEIAGLDEGDANLLRSLANQVAAAIRNARLFEAVEAALTDARAAQELYLEQAWQKAKLTSPGNQYLYKESDTAAVDEAQRQMFVKARKEALTTSRPTVVSVEDSSSARKALVAPINLQGKPIGGVQLYTSDPGAWTEDNLALIETVLDQLAQSAENLRLFEEIRERADYEQLIGEITQKLRQAPNLDRLAKIMAEELGHALGVHHSLVKVGVKTQPATPVELSSEQNGKNRVGDN